jgi:hypothetical protein
VAGLVEDPVRVTRRLALRSTLAVLVLGVVVVLAMQLRASTESAPRVTAPLRTGDSTPVAPAAAPPAPAPGLTDPAPRPAPSEAPAVVPAPAPAPAHPAPVHTAPSHPAVRHPAPAPVPSRHDPHDGDQPARGHRHHDDGDSGHDRDDDSGDGPHRHDGPDSPREDQARRQVADEFCDHYHLPREQCERAAARNR